MKQTNFTQAYLKSLNLVKQDADKEITECDKTEVDECGTECDKKEIVQDKDQKADDEEVKDVEDTSSDEAETSDDQAEDNGQEQGEGEASDDETSEEDEKTEEDQAPTCFCFKTINKDLIDAINSGFDKVVFTVKAKDDDGNDTTTEVEFSADAFEDFGECEEEQDEEGSDEESNVCPLCGTDPCSCEEGDAEGQGNQGDDDDEEFDGVNSFESVFKRYQGALVK